MTEISHRSPIVISIFNYKGGVGKTTTTVNLAVCLAALGCRTLLIDVDGQGNATSSLGMATKAAAGSYNVIAGTLSLKDASVPTVYPGLSICPATDELAGSDLELALTEEPQTLLRRKVLREPLDVDVVVIDCPPALGLLPVNALVASDWVILPVSPHPLAREGLQKAWHSVQKIRVNINRKLQVMGMLLTVTEPGDVYDRFADSIRADFGRRVLPITVPRDQIVLEASAKDCPTVVFDPDCDASRAYVNLAAAVHATVLEPAGIGLSSVGSQEDAVRTVVAMLHRWRREYFRDSGGDMRTVDIYTPLEQPDTPPARRPRRSGGVLLFLLGLCTGLALVALVQQFTRFF